MVAWKNLDTLASYDALLKTERVELATVMAGENGAERVKNYSVPMAEGLVFNYGAKAVDDKVLAAVLVHVNLDKVVTAAKCSERSLKTLGVLEISVATELCEVKSLLSALPNVSAAGDEVRRLIHLLKININVAKVHGVHSATDIDTDH